MEGTRINRAIACRISDEVYDALYSERMTYRVDTAQET